MPQVVDRELALKRAGGRPELAAELHGMLLKSIPELQQAIEQSWQAQDMDTLYTHVHKINGSTRYCGVPELESCCETLETRIKRSDGDLNTAYEALIQALQQVMETDAGL